MQMPLGHRRILARIDWHDKMSHSRAPALVGLGAFGAVAGSGETGA